MTAITWTKRTPGRSLGQVAARQLAAAGAFSVCSWVLVDQRLDLWQLRYLVPARVRDRLLAVSQHSGRIDSAAKR